MLISPRHQFRQQINKAAMALLVIKNLILTLTKAITAVVITD